MAGIITDTGGFRFNSVTAETFEFAAELIRKGAKIKEICRIALRKKSKAHCELEKLIYNRMEYFEDGKIALAYLTLEDVAIFKFSALCIDKLYDIPCIVP